MKRLGLEVKEYSRRAADPGPRSPTLTADGGPLTPDPVTPEHEVRFLLYSYEVDARERLSVGALCQFLQEAADQHATKLGVSMERLGREHLAWVLHRLRVEIEAYPKTGAELTVRTWPTGFDRVSASRDWEVSSKGRLVARASSDWVMVDVERRALARIPEWALELGHAQVTARAPLLELKRRKPSAVGAPEVQADFAVRRSDLDLVGHVNNVRYVEWALETVPEATYTNLRPRSFSVVFRRESRFGQTVAVETQGVGPAHFAHRLLDRATRTELVQVESEWAASD